MGWLSKIMSTFQLRVESNLQLHWCSLEQFPLSVESYPIWIDFALLRFVIGPVNPSDAKLKPTTSWSPAFSRALGSLLAFTLSFHWFFKGIFLSDWPPLRQLWFGFAILIEKRSTTRLRWSGKIALLS